MGQGITIVTIDGPAGAGKSTVAKRLSKELNFSYLDTGAMYRALTLKALNVKADLSNEDVLTGLAKETGIDLENADEGVRVFLDGEDVTREIRSLDVTNNTFYIARAPRVREIMVQLQREIGNKKSVVVEGRDVGTVVFPKADYKFYLDADVDERCERRFKELTEKGSTVEKLKLLDEVKERDRKDISRDTGPLKQAEDAVYIDSTNMSIDEVVDEMLKHVKRDVL